MNLCPFVGVDSEYVTDRPYIFRRADKDVRLLFLNPLTFDIAHLGSTPSSSCSQLN